MALIKCSECSHDVSTLTDKCPNCGCPTSHMINSNNNRICIEDEMYDLSRNINKIQIIRSIRNKLKLTYIDAKQIVDYIIENREVPVEYKDRLYPTCFSELKPRTAGDNQNVIPQYFHEAKKVQQPTPTPKCPTCGSTSLEKIPAGARFIDRLAYGFTSPESKAQYRCKSCGYLW